jgi:3-methyladenine DNA glycosylase AlkD
MPKSPKYIANHVRRVLKDGGSAPHSQGVQHFFKEEIQSRGWRAKELRQVAGSVRRAVLRDQSLEFLVAVADDLFRGRVLEEKIFGVVLLEKSVAKFTDREFRRFESWLDRVTTWADHDALVSYLIGPMLVSERKRVPRVFRWAKLPDRWHRRAAAVALFRGARKRLFFAEIVRICDQLLTDQDDMVQKGLGWLLRETAKADPRRTLPLLMRIRSRAPRLVLRAACETLPPTDRARVMKRP